MMAAEGQQTPGEKLFDLAAEIFLYGLCLWFAWYLGGVMRGKFWGTIAVLISIALFARAEQCRRETRRAGDFNTDFYIMVPFMCGITLLLRVWLNRPRL
jgi:hypothetical protein